MTIDVAVIGGGVSGLATACELQRRGHRVAVLEREVRVGGKAQSQRIGGYLMERGPTAVSAASATANGWSEALGLDGQRLDLGPGVRQRYLLANGALVGIPPHAFGFLVRRYLSVPGRLRMLAEVLPAWGRSRADESVTGFFQRRFGREFLERVIEPLVGGMFAGDPDRMAMHAAYPALVGMERRHGSVIRGLMRSRLGGGRMPGRRLCSWHDGVGALPRALAIRLGPCVRTGVTVRTIRGRGPEGFRVDTAGGGVVDASAVVVATPPHAAAALLERMAPLAAEAAALIEAPPLAVVFLGYRRSQVAHPLDGIGCLHARTEGRVLSGVLFSSTMFQGRAPGAEVALTGYVGGARAPELARLPAEDLLAMVRSEVADLLGITGPPLLTRVCHWRHGLPQYNIGHDNRIAALRAAEGALPGLFVTGNYFHGISVASCLDEATRTAGRVEAFLTGRSRAAASLPPARGQAAARC
ncbi:MAG: Protoporphyrinogen oxidase [Gammaproteobacteria bacterium]|nr:Protoporphyrinogen oxidase [Gammaproteobacteria bacterium]